jgi:alkylation response protein AidB-like acyl-CoA dehydrogenase
LGKLAMSRIMHGSADFAFRMQGEDSLVYDYDDPTAYPVDRDLMFSFINSIGGGSDQIQRNIISERVLGLPKGYEPDKGVPFRDVRKGVATRSVSQA